MPDLIAQGTEAEQRWRRPLPVGRAIELGRACGEWSAAWDERISRRHVVATCAPGRLEVQVLPGARNPVFYRGRREEHFTLKPGEHFVIGATSFTLAEERAAATLDAPQPVNERTFEVAELRRAAFRQSDQRIAALARLPDIISGSASDSELFVRLVSVLMAGMVPAKAAALVKVAHPEAPVDVLHWDRRALAAHDFHASERLIRQAITRGESVVHVWNAASSGGADFTLSEGVDWAFCTPVPGACCRGLAIYATGMFPPEAPAGDPEWLRDDLKFAELVGSTFSSLREAQLAVRRQASLGQFFSPVVLTAIAESDPETVLAPREAEVSVLFCDLRGFTSRSERQAADLLGLLNRTSEALGVMTQQILRHGGVVGDFHGDAAMGFWGWPLPQDDAIERACRAALAIRASFEASSQEGDSSLADFRIGIGIASGRAVAGKIGTIDQVKVTVFGPVVNLASRLESLTKTLQAPILLDSASARIARLRLTGDEARIRRVARMRPAGLQTPIDVSELLPPQALADEQIAAFEAAVETLIAGDWEQAMRLLHHVPEHDLVKDYLLQLIAQHHRRPPPDWDGAITLREK
jgi:adenylate cyclase